MAFQFNQGDRPLPGYTIERGVGRGGFGEVYYAKSDGGKEVALKYLRENPQVELRGVAHCLNLKSPYLVDLHDVKQNADGDFFVIMEYVSGPSLRDLMNNEPDGLGAQKAAYFLREIGKGLAYLHDRGIVHRDLKPGNIFYEDGYVKIGDYGLAKIMAASQHSGQTVSVGTVHYMAPEVGSGNYDRTIDIYAMGVMLYEMLLGRVPYSGATMGEVLMKHLTAQPEVDELPEPFPHVIRKALAKDPKDRYQTINEMLAEVFAVEDLDRSVAAFEPVGLSAVAARVAAQVAVAQQAVAPGAQPAGGATISGPGPGPLGTGSSNVGQQVPPPVIDPTPHAAGGRFGRIHGRISARVGHVAERIDHSTIGQQVSAAARRPSHWAERIFVAFLISAGISFGASLIAAGGCFDYTLACFLHVLALVVGVGFGYWLCVDRLQLAGKWLPRFVITACAAILLTPVGIGIGIVPISPFAANVLHLRVEHWVTPFLLTLFLCDWPWRFHEGRKGRVHLGSAFSAGLFAFIVGMIFTQGNQGLTIAAIVAATSLTLQTIAGIWPLRSARMIARAASGVAPDGGSPGHGGPGHKTPFAVARDAANAAYAERYGERASPGVAVEAGGTAPPMAYAAAPAVEYVRRSGGVRTLWLFVAVLLALTSAMLFIASGTLRLSNDDEAGFIVGGIVAGSYFLFALWCAAARFKKGLWRGIFRKAVFFTGAGLSGGCGAALGLFSYLGNEGDLILIGCIIAGGLMSLFVWFVPVGAYMRPQDAARDGDTTPQQRKGRQLKLVGGILMGAALIVLLPILVAATEEGMDEEVIPAVMVPVVGMATALLIIGVRKGRPRKPQPAKLEIPLRAVFEIDANANLAGLIERHMTLLGYRLTSSSDLLWSFARGNWTGQFWQSNIRQWLTRINIAAYVLDNGGYRLTCYVDVESAFNQPDQKMFTVLKDELNDMKELLGGRDLARSNQGEPA